MLDPESVKAICAAICTCIGGCVGAICTAWVIVAMLKD